MATNRYPVQAELIERVRAILNLSNEALAAEVAVRPETMQKYAAGYQKAGDKLMRIIARLPQMRSSSGASASTIKPVNLSRDVQLDPPSTQEQIALVLTDGNLDEIRLLRQVVETLYRQVNRRQTEVPVTPRTNGKSTSPAVASGPMIFDRRPRLLPAMGYIPAGLPQEIAAQDARQFVVVREDEFPDADFVLQVQGDSMVDADIHHGDWVVMSSRRLPRPGNVVAAMIDNETTLKTYLLDERRQPYLRAENGAYPARITPRGELQTQGVMLGKLTGRPVAMSDVAD